jgi:hypothetical protein
LLSNITALTGRLSLFGAFATKGPMCLHRFVTVVVGPTRRAVGAGFPGARQGTASLCVVLRQCLRLLASTDYLGLMQALSSERRECATRPGVSVR